MKKYTMYITTLVAGLIIGGILTWSLTTVPSSNATIVNIIPEPVNDLLIIEEALKELKPQLDTVILKEILLYSDEYAKEYNLPLTLVLSIMNRESGFNPLAVSSKGAKGLMQIMTKVHADKLKEMGIDAYQAMHIGNSIKLGCWILREYYDQTKEMKKALRKYVGGVHDSYYVDILTWYVTLNTKILERKNNVEKEGDKVDEQGVQQTG
jgi:soluble lytic murein transglycosylase-like protein